MKYKKLKLLFISLSILVITSCESLTIEQVFEKDFSNKIKPSVPIEQLLNSPTHLIIDKDHNYDIVGYLRNVDSKALDVYVDLPKEYKIDRIWFIYSIFGRRTNIASTETDIFPEQKIDPNDIGGKYYEFYNINGFIESIIIRIKKDSQTYYLKGSVNHPSYVS